MHPLGNGLKLPNRKSEEFVLAPLRKYKKHFKKGDIIIFSGHLNKYKYKNDWTKHYETFLKQTENLGMKYILISPTPIFPGERSLRARYTCQEE